MDRELNKLRSLKNDTILRETGGVRERGFRLPRFALIATVKHMKENSESNHCYVS